MKAHSEFTRQEFQDDLGLSKSDAIIEINRLVASGVVLRIGSGRNVRYRSDVPNTMPR